MSDLFRSIMIMSAPNGARRQRADHPALPVTVEQVAEESRRIVEAGALSIHLHARDSEGTHSLSPSLYREVTAAVRAKLTRNALIQITTECVGRYTPDDIESTIKEVRPDAVSISLTELIPDVSRNEHATTFLNWMIREAIAPQFILYSPIEVERFHRLLRAGVIPHQNPFVLFVLGSYKNQVNAYPRDVLPYLAHHDQALPWAVCAFGRGEQMCLSAAAALGGHVRVGFENNINRPDGSMLVDNAESVRTLKGTITDMGHTIADYETTRAFIQSTAR